MSAVEQHQHQWRRISHFDLCHSFTSNYVCECGAQRTITIERDPNDAEGMAFMWLDPDGAETGVEGGCGRCRELIAGALPQTRDYITEATA